MNIKELNEITFTIPETELVGLENRKMKWVVKGSRLMGKDEIIEKIKQCVRSDRRSWLSDSPIGDDPRSVCEDNALLRFLDLLSSALYTEANK